MEEEKKEVKVEETEEEASMTKKKELTPKFLTKLLTLMTRER